MRSVYLFVFCAAISKLAQAAPLELEIKGIRVGMTEAQIREKYPYIYCAPAVENTNEDRDCHISGAKNRSASDYVFELATFADRDVISWHLKISDKVGLKQAVALMESSDFDVVTSAIMVKYQKPQSISSGVVKNLTGAKLKNSVAVWRQKSNVLSVEKYALNLTTMAVTLSSQEFLRSSRKMEQEKAKSDL